MATRLGRVLEGTNSEEKLWKLDNPEHATRWKSFENTYPSRFKNDVFTTEEIKYIQLYSVKVINAPVHAVVYEQTDFPEIHQSRCGARQIKY